MYLSLYIYNYFSFCRKWLTKSTFVDPDSTLEILILWITILGCLFSSRHKHQWLNHLAKMYGLIEYITEFLQMILLNLNGLYYVFFPIFLKHKYFLYYCMYKSVYFIIILLFLRPITIWITPIAIPLSSTEVFFFLMINPSHI